VLACVLAGTSLIVPAAPSADGPKSSPVSLTSLHNPGPTYNVSVGLDGEVFPVFANYASLQKPERRRWGTIAVTVRNSSPNRLQERITVQVPGWSDEEIKLVDLPAGAVRTYSFAPTFLPRLYHNREIAAGTAVVKVSEMAGNAVFKTTAPVHLRAANDMFWGAGLKYAAFVASWVTPHDARVETFLGAAKRFAPDHRLPGYEAGKTEAAQERSTITQARAVYLALRSRGVSYVKSSTTFGDNQEWSERIRTPREALRDNSANCIDGALMYASLFENLGMDPIIVLVPGHAYVGVRLTRISSRYLYIETSYTGRTTFEGAVAAAQRSMSRYTPSSMTFIRIADARQTGIYPMPE
jgi:hypothetical protein